MSLPTFVEFTLTLRLRIKELEGSLRGIVSTPFTSLVELGKNISTKQETMVVKELRAENKSWLQVIVDDYNKYSELKSKLETLLLETSEQDYIQVICDNSHLTKSLEQLAHRINSIL